MENVDASLRRRRFQKQMAQAVNQKWLPPPPPPDLTNPVTACIYETYRQWEENARAGDWFPRLQDLGLRAGWLHKLSNGSIIFCRDVPYFQDYVAWVEQIIQTGEWE